VSTGDGDGDERRPIYSIGAIARMLSIEPATLRAWEERYAVVVPIRSRGGQRLYSRDELEQLRFVIEQIAGGATPGSAHRLLAGRLEGRQTLSLPEPGGATLVILLAERDRYSADLLEYLLRTEGYDVSVAFDPDQAERLFRQRGPQLAIIELMISGGGLELCARLTNSGDVPVLAMSALNLTSEALAAGASAFLLKPVVPLELVSTVRDLLGSSALTRRSTAGLY
jgi:CheY-like chemotaxis protein